MTGDYFPYQHEFLRRPATRTINEMRGMHGVVYGITSTPPGKHPITHRTSAETERGLGDGGNGFSALIDRKESSDR